MFMPFLMREELVRSHLKLVVWTLRRYVDLLMTLVSICGECVDGGMRMFYSLYDIIARFLVRLSI